MAEWEDPDERWLDSDRMRDLSVPRQRSSNPRDWLDLPWTAPSSGRGGSFDTGDEIDDGNAGALI